MQGHISSDKPGIVELAASLQLDCQNAFPFLASILLPIAFDLIFCTRSAVPAKICITIGGCLLKIQGDRCSKALKTMLLNFSGRQLQCLIGQQTKYPFCNALRYLQVDICLLNLGWQLCKAACQGTHPAAAFPNTHRACKPAIGTAGLLLETQSLISAHLIVAPEAPLDALMTSYNEPVQKPSFPAVKMIFSGHIGCCRDTLSHAMCAEF